jgi:hypothetical protein
MSRRLRKVYVRDRNKVFRAIPGIQYGEYLIIIDKSVYTLSSQFEAADEFIVLEKVRE